MSNYNLDKLVKESKENLSKQGLPVDTKDIYAEFREQENKTEGREDFKIKNSPNEEELNEEFIEEPDIDEYDEPIFPNGPLTSQVKSWKKQWETYDIYAIEVMNNYFVFRTLNRFEYKQIIALPNIDALQREEIICETCTLWPQNYKWDVMATEKAGLPSTFSQIIMEKSGFTKEYAIQVL